VITLAVGLLDYQYFFITMDRLYQMRDVVQTSSRFLNPQFWLFNLSPVKFKPGLNSSYKRPYVVCNAHLYESNLFFQQPAVCFHFVILTIMMEIENIEHLLPDKIFQNLGLNDHVGALV